jgi:hypothetical protein
MASRVKPDVLQIAADSVVPRPDFIAKTVATAGADHDGDPGLFVRVFMKKGVTVTPARRKQLWDYGERVRRVVQQIDPDRIAYLTYDEMTR